jgi:hypothetical protein
VTFEAAQHAAELNSKLASIIKVRSDCLHTLDAVQIKLCQNKVGWGLG